MQDFITYINALNSMTWLIIGSLVLVGGVLMQQVVDSRGLTTMFMVAFQAGALVLNYLSVRFDIVIVPNPEANLIFLSTIGMSLALLVALLFLRISDAISESTRHRVTRDGNPTR